MAVIREYSNEIEAQVARSILEANDIRAVVISDDAGGMLPSLLVVLPARLAVPEALAERALELLDVPPDDEDEEEPTGEFESPTG